MKLPEELKTRLSLKAYFPPGYLDSDWYLDASLPLIYTRVPPPSGPDYFWNLWGPDEKTLSIRYEYLSLPQIYELLGDLRAKPEDNVKNYISEYIENIDSGDTVEDVFMAGYAQGLFKSTGAEIMTPELLDEIVIYSYNWHCSRCNKVPSVAELDNLGEYIRNNLKKRHG